jgi:hypothetical protein
MDHHPDDAALGLVMAARGGIRSSICLSESGLASIRKGCLVALCGLEVDVFNA